ncbi:FadR/GntR family transcriptional regulator [Agromyces marinus]|uniref:GntR family transcriptional regulator n=1 Tax=Agromyces marinus TaxID=1389020 RepID=A0ABM8H002_9MICO|nr:FadR/GntR family transcriptional regulator [Agromyces marinus]UIP57744.1 Putative L-lactate dehydrogenase operon regulatory protein [Agromyces marinus]BDZ54082.1 GntR family transcriptional regulator [Agromyces marinus]
MASTPAPDGAPIRSRSNVVIDGIREMITSGELMAGSRLPVERELGARLGVSRGPLREGVRALVVLGVLETRQGDGTYVTSLEPGQLLEPLGMLAELQSPENSVHLLGVRRVLEPEAAAHAALRITEDELARARGILDRGEAILEVDGQIDLEATIDVDTEFHRLIATASGNPAFAAIIEALVSRTARARLWRAIHQGGAVHDTQREHRAILEALEAGDPDRARIRMSVHVLGVEEFTASRVDELPAEAPDEG